MENEKLGFVSIDWSKVPDILRSRENNKRMTNLLKRGEDYWSPEEEQFILNMESAIIKNFTENYGYTQNAAKEHVKTLREYHKNKATDNSRLQ